MPSGSPRVFLSYSHDSPEHCDAVLKLARRLQHDGCTVIIDQDQPWVSEGLTLWMRNQVQQADFVLVICTEIYKRRAEGAEVPPAGAGPSWEGAIIRLDLYEANGRNEKFVPVLIRPEDKIHRPLLDNHADSCLQRVRREEDRYEALVSDFWRVRGWLHSTINRIGRRCSF